MSRPLPVEKIAEACVPGVGATTPLSRKPEVDAVARPSVGVAAPKSRATAARSTSLSRCEACTAAGAAMKPHVQYASCHARTRTTAASSNVPSGERAAGAAGEMEAMGTMLPRRRGGEVDVEVAPWLVAERVLAEVPHPRMHEHV